MHQERLLGLDVFRGWAILLMVLFHLAYDLNYFHFIDINLKKDFFWVYARYVIVSMFLFSMGISLALVHRPNIRWKRMYKRTFMLSVASILVSVATYIQFPDRWVYFGILHFILFASWLGLLLVPFPSLSFLLGLFILVGSYFGFLHTQYLFDILQSPLHLPKYTEDLVIVFPWFSVVLFGIAFVGFAWQNKVFTFPLLNATNRFNLFLAFSGRHALLIYLLHQPILFGLIMLLAL